MSQAIPHVSSADAPYWNAMAEGRLTMQHCSCGTWHWPAVWRCGACGAFDPPWEDIAFQGQVFSWQKTFHPFGGTEDIGLPYVTVLAELPHAGGRRLLAIYEGDDALLRPGLPLVGRFATTMHGGQPIPALRWLPA